MEEKFTGRNPANHLFHHETIINIIKKLGFATVRCQEKVPKIIHHHRIRKKSQQQNPRYNWLTKFHQPLSFPPKKQNPPPRPHRLHILDGPPGPLTCRDMNNQWNLKNQPRGFPEIHHWGRELIWPYGMLDGSKGGTCFGTRRWEVASVSVTHCLLFYVYVKHVQKTQQLARKPTHQKTLWLACWPFSAKRWYDQTLLAANKVPAPSTVITWVITPQRGLK